MTSPTVPIGPTVVGTSPPRPSSLELGLGLNPGPQAGNETVSTTCSPGCRAAGSEPEKCRCSCHGANHGQHDRATVLLIDTVAVAHAPNCSDRTLRSSDDIFNRSIVKWRCLGCGAVAVRPKGETS